MSDAITPQQFHDSSGLEDWRVLSIGATATFKTADFATGVSFVEAIGGLADAANHHPDVDLRFSSVTVRVFSHDTKGLSLRDVALARLVSAAARHLGVEPDPLAAEEVQVTFDARVPEAVIPFWRAVTGYDELPEHHLGDNARRGPTLWFQEMDAERTQRNRIHLDLFLPHDVAEARIEAALAAGGSIVNDANAPAWWTLADPEGNEVDVATWLGRE